MAAFRVMNVQAVNAATRAHAPGSIRGGKNAVYLFMLHYRYGFSIGFDLFHLFSGSNQCVP